MRALLGAIAGFFIGAGIGALLVFLLSGNTHDKGLEQVMTAFFVAGPIGAIFGLVMGLMWKPRRQV